MKIDDYAKEFLKHRHHPDKIRELADLLQEEHGTKNAEPARAIQCRVSLSGPQPVITIRGSSEEVSLGYVLCIILSERSVTEQKLQGYVVDLRHGHHLYLSLFSDYAQRLHSFLDHGLIIHES